MQPIDPHYSLQLGTISFTGSIYSILEEYVYEKASQNIAISADTDTDISKECDTSASSPNDNNSNQSLSLNSNNKTWRNNNQGEREAVRVTTAEDIMSTSNLNTPVTGTRKNDDTARRSFSSPGYVANATNTSELSFGWAGMINEGLAISHQYSDEYVVEETRAMAQDAITLDAGYLKEEHPTAILIDDSSKPNAYIRESSVTTSSSAFTPMTDASVELNTPYIIDPNVSSLTLSLPEYVDVHQSTIAIDDSSKYDAYIRESSLTTSLSASTPLKDAGVALNTIYVIDATVALSLPDNVDVNQGSLVEETYPLEQTATSTSLVSGYVPDTITTIPYNQELEAESYDLSDVLQSTLSESASNVYLQEEQSILNTIHPQPAPLHHKEEISSTNNHNNTSQALFSSEPYLSASFHAMIDTSHHPHTPPTPPPSSTNLHIMINVPPHSLTPPKDTSGSYTDTTSSYVSDVSAVHFASSSSSRCVSSTENTDSSMSTALFSSQPFATELDSILYDPSDFSGTDESFTEKRKLTSSSYLLQQS